MANKKISELQAATSITKDDIFVVVSDGSTKKVSMSNIIDFFYPIGSIVENENSEFNPNTSFGGTWELIKGKNIIGVDENDSDYNLPGIEGGSKTHKLTVDELPPHNHPVNGAGNVEWAQGEITFMANGGGDNPGRSTRTGLTGGNQPFNIVQPFRTAYIWRRVA